MPREVAVRAISGADDSQNELSAAKIRSACPVAQD